MATATYRRNRLQPVHGVCRWIGHAGNGNRLLEITGQVYEVEDLAGGGWRLYRLAEGGGLKVYTIEADGWTCDCPDAVYRPGRPGGCRHVAALGAALAALK